MSCTQCLVLNVLYSMSCTQCLVLNVLYSMSSVLNVKCTKCLVLIVMLDSHNIIITGDLNFHLDNPAELDVRRFSETLADRGMTQLVKFPTHRGGHILDVAIVR